MENRKNVLNLMYKVRTLLASNSGNTNVLNLIIKFFETYKPISDFFNRTDLFDDEAKTLLYANTYVLLEKQCEVIYKSMLKCVSGNFEEKINKTVEKMNTTLENKQIIRDFLFRLLSNDKIADLSYLLALLENVKIVMQAKPIIKEYVPGVTTMALADTAFYQEHGLINEQKSFIWNPDNILITVWNSGSLETQRASLEHELTHLIVQPSTMLENVDNHKQMEDAVEKYLRNLDSNLNKKPITQRHKFESMDNDTHKDGWEGLVIPKILREDPIDVYGDKKNDHDSYTPTPKPLEKEILPNDLTVENVIDFLKRLGFKILKQDGEIIAFFEKRNIVFYCDSLDNNRLKLSFFQQPYIDRDRPWIAFLKGFSECIDQKIDFPLFTDGSFLRLDSSTDDDTQFINSMKKIASMPELYNAVGYENQQIIDKVVAENSKRTNK